MALDDKYAENAETLWNGSNIDLDLSNWNTSNVIDMGHMFNSVGSRVDSFRLDISGWNTSKVENIQTMFDYFGEYTSSITVIIPRTNGSGLNNTTTSSTDTHAFWWV